MPTTISQLFSVPSTVFDATGAFDSFIDLDSQLHVDPHLLDQSAAPEMQEARKALTLYFEDTINLLRLCPEMKGALWDAVLDRLRIPEVKGVALGFSRDEGDGAAIGTVLAEALALRAFEIVWAGERNPRIFELVGLFTDDFGPDRTSDFVLGIANAAFAQYTERIAQSLGIPTATVAVGGHSFQLPVHGRRGGNRALYLVPKDVLRQMPVALNYSEIASVAAYNGAIRDKFNALFASAGSASKAPTKADLWRRIQNDPSLLPALLQAYIDAGGSAYDFELDPAAEARRFIEARALASRHPLALDTPSAGWTPGSALDAVTKICEHFKKLVEKNGLWASLWIAKNTGKVLTEHAMQRIFFGIALTYCRDGSPDLDISPETNAGPGPVDFKFSHGAAAKVTVEMKKSTHGKLLHGYETQLARYNAAEGTASSVFLIIQINDDRAAIDHVREARRAALARGEKAPTIVVVDARPQESASKA